MSSPRPARTRPTGRQARRATSLSVVPTDDLLCEMIRRTIAQDGDAIPDSLLQLACLLASTSGPFQSRVFAESLRDAADQLENLKVVV